MLEELNMMSFLAVPFELNAEGKVKYGEARQVSSEFGARCLTAAMVATSPGALVLSKTNRRRSISSPAMASELMNRL